jgi:hypothetical protein
MKTPTQFAKELANNLTKITSTEFFNQLHDACYSDINITFMEDLINLIDRDDELCIKHTLLYKYGILSASSSETGNFKKKLINNHSFIEGKDYKVKSIRVKGNSNVTTKNIYYLTPKTFKTCLLITQNHPGQTTQSKQYIEYYFLLEKFTKYFAIYEKLLSDNLREQERIKHAKEINQKNEVIEQKDDKIDNQTKKIDKLQRDLTEVLANTRFIMGQNVDLNNKVVQISSKMDTMMKLYIQDGNGYMVFQKTVNEHAGKFTANATNIEKTLYPGLASLKALFLCAYYKDGEVHVYSICRNFSSSLKTRLKELKKRYIDWETINPVGISLICTEINLELTFLEKNSFWENGEYNKDKKCYVFKYDINMDEQEILTCIHDGFDRATNYKINNYQKNIYEYDISNEHDGIIIGELKNQDSGFHNESRDLITKVINTVMIKNAPNIRRPDITIGGRIVLLSDRHYYLTKLYQFLKSQNTPAIIEEFRNRI